MVRGWRLRGWGFGGRAGARLVVLGASAAVGLGGLGVLAGSALAGPPETPKTEPASEETSEAAKLHGILDPVAAGSAGTFQFLYRRSPSECEGEGEGKATAAEAMTGSQGQAVEAEVTGLLPGSRYTFCLQALNEASETSTGAPETFATVPVAPVIVGEPQTATEASSLETTNETGSAADLDAKVIPGGEDKYRFEYGATTGYNHVIEGLVSPAGTPTTPVAISRLITGLTANTTYHWRLVIENTAGKAESVDHTFVYDTLAGESSGCLDEAARQARGSLSLPDCRAYELVTPPEKNGALIGHPFAGIGEPVISDDGTKLISSSIQCFEASPSCIGQRGNDGAVYEFARTPSGWATHPLVPAFGALDGAETYTTWAADPNHGTSVFSALAPTPLLQEDLWVRQADGTLVTVGPLEEEGRFTGLVPNQLYLDEWLANADLSHVVYESVVDTGNEKGSAWAFDPTVKSTDLYEYAETLEPQPNGFPLMVGVQGGYEEGANHSLVSVCSTMLGFGHNTASQFAAPLSRTGRTVFFTAEGRDAGGCEANSSEATAPPVNQLWARVDGEVGPAKAGPGLPEAHSVLISAATGALGSGCTTTECLKDSTTEPADARFEAATPDGSATVFTSAQQLTDNAGQGSENLYESVCAEPCGAAGEEPAAKERRLFDVSEASDQLPVTNGPRVLGLEALSADGSHVYFVAEGVLTGSEENHNHEHAEESEPNLYVYEHGAGSQGHVAFIATLSSAPGELQDVQSNWNLHGGGHEANVTPEGRFLVFTSHRALTADDTRGEGPAQVYEYDAQAGTLTRISIGQDGYNDDGLEGQLGAYLSGPSAGDAAIVSAASTQQAKTVPERLDPTMSDDGSFVFFQSPVALAPGALNDVVDGVKAETTKKLYAQNFYEYHDGHVYLLASVTTETGQKRSTLLGSDVSGSNVFFGTFESLVPEDVDTNLDFYDAHVCSEEAPCSAPVVASEGCGEGACQAAGGAASGAGAGVVPASQAFSGAGNLAAAPAAVSPVAVAVRPRVLTNAQKLKKALAACKRDRSKGKRTACEKQARARYGPKAKHASRKVGR